MSLSPAHFVLLVCTLLYTAFFGITFVMSGDKEFLWYVATVILFILLIAITLRRSSLPLGILTGLSVWGFLHMAGGGVPVGSGVLYGVTLVHLADVGDTFIFKYDQFVHAFGFFVATLAMHHLIKIRMRPEVPAFGVALLAAAAGMGLGALNEVVEFVPVLLLEETGVGGYYNTALDLVFNMVGAVSAAAFVYFRHASS